MDGKNPFTPFQTKNKNNNKKIENKENLNKRTYLRII